jgi:dTDP-glucose 4,6-dehydratase
MAEEHPLNPTTPYAAAKASADRLVYSYWVTYDIPAVIVRPFNNYGPRQHLEKVIPRFIARAIRGKPLTVHGSGASTRDWLYVEDCCRGLDRAMHVDLEKIKGQAINLGTGIELDIASIAKRIQERYECRIEFVGERPGQVQRHRGSTEKAEALLGWRADTSFDEGLQRAIEWYANNEDWWREQIWMETVQIRTKTGEIEYH